MAMVDYAKPVECPRVPCPDGERGYLFRCHYGADSQDHLVYGRHGTEAASGVYERLYYGQGWVGLTSIERLPTGDA